MSFFYSSYFGMKNFVQDDSLGFVGMATPPLWGGQSPVDFGASKCVREGAFKPTPFHPFLLARQYPSTLK